MIHIARRLTGGALRAAVLASLLAVIAGGAVLVATQAQAQTPPAIPFASDRLSVEVLGEGPDVILVPGLASSREVWRPLAERLSTSHRVHLVQLAGFAGESWSHADGPLLGPAVEALAAYVEAGGLERPAMIGHSMGGLAALMLAQDHPERLGRVMTVDSLPFYSAMFGPQVTPETARPFADQAATGMLAADAATFAAMQARTAEALARDPAMREAIVAWSLASDRRAMATAIGEVMTTDVRPGLASMSLPVWAVYAADADGGVPADRADALWGREYAPLPEVRLVRVDDARHFIMADQPARFFELVDAFLAETAAP